MPENSYKQLEEASQRGVNKEHKPNPDKGRDVQRCQ